MAATEDPAFNMGWTPDPSYHAVLGGVHRARVCFCRRPAVRELPFKVRSVAPSHSARGQEVDVLCFPEGDLDVLMTIVPT